MNDISDEFFLFDRVWFPRVFRIARESGLDWLRMCAAAEVLSNGDPRARFVDWDFIAEHLATDNPVFSAFYDEYERPTAELIDRGTRWGLFQILGQDAVTNGRDRGRLVNLIDVVKNTQIICHMLVQKIDEVQTEAKRLRANLQVIEAEQLMSQLPQVAEKMLGWPTDLIDEKVQDLSSQIENLTDLEY